MKLHFRERLYFAHFQMTDIRSSHERKVITFALFHIVQFEYRFFDIIYVIFDKWKIRENLQLWKEISKVFIQALSNVQFLMKWKNQLVS